jgi:hypothetical protein
MVLPRAGYSNPPPCTDWRFMTSVYETFKDLSDPQWREKQANCEHYFELFTDSPRRGYPRSWKVCRKCGKRQEIQ